MNGTSWRLLVTQGPQAGLLVDVPLLGTLGRSRSSDVHLSDIAISRRHLELRSLDEGLEVTVLPGATPLVIGAQNIDRAVLGHDETFTVGATCLRVLRVSAPPSRSRMSVETTFEQTDRSALFEGDVAELRGLASLFSLLETLDGDQTKVVVESVVERFASWAHDVLGASEVRFGSPAVIPRAESGSLTVETRTDCIVAHVPTLLPDRPWLELVLPPDPGLTDPQRRLLMLAARLVASAHLRSEAARTLAEDRTLLRQQAIGSSKDFLGSSAAARTVAGLIERLTASDVSALLLGESGVGKTYVARLIHERGPRALKPFRVVNCASIPESLLEAELFGHERGAFTGAQNARAGAFEAVGDGTLFLDEIGELPLASQAKMLRVLEDRVFERLGSNRSLPLRARIITATNRNLDEMVRAGKFRADLFFRVSVVNLTVPSLRDRADDVMALAGQFLADLSSSAGRRIEGFSADAAIALRAYDWPGNVRELRNAIEHAIVMGDGSVIRASDLPQSVTSSAPIVAVEPPPARDAATPPVDVAPLPASLAWLEAKAIDAALRATGGNRSQAAAILGINRVTLYKKLRGSKWERE